MLKAKSIYPWTEIQINMKLMKGLRLNVKLRITLELLTRLW